MKSHTTGTVDSFGRTLAEARAAAGFENQAALAKALGCSQQSVSRWEAGQSRPRQAQLAKLATVLRLDPAELVPPTEVPPAVASFAQNFPFERLDGSTFERLIEYVLHALYAGKGTVRRAGGSGHEQSGLDLTVDLSDGRRLSFQCKRVQQFGPADVVKAINAHTAAADSKHLVLSRIASPQTAEMVRSVSGWTLWDKEDLSRIIRMELTDEQQDRLVDIFFRGQRLALLGRSEPGPWLAVEEFFAPFVGRGTLLTHDWTLKGREKELKELSAALQTPDARLVLLVGAGGIGKSRLLKDALRDFSAAHPAVVVRMLSTAREATPESLEALGSGPKLLVVDDAHDRDGLAGLMHYAAVRANNARLLLASRPYAEARIVGEAATVAIDNPPVVRLGRISIEQSTELAREVLASFGGSSDLIEGIVRATRDCPLVTVMAARIIAKDGSSLERAKNESALRATILGKFADVVVGNLGSPGDNERIKNTLDVLALVQPFHVEDPALVRLLRSLKGIDEQEAARILRILVEGGVVYKRGHQYRLMPDLLGDYIIEQSCVTLNGRLSPFAVAAFKEVDIPHLKNVMVNLGRLDWRLRDGDPSRSKLLDVIWQSVDDVSDEYDPRLVAIDSVAIYQPRQALDFVQDQIAKGNTFPALTSILRGIGYNFDYLDEVCELLWELGRLDKRELHSHPDHPIRVLSELCGFEERKPLAYNEHVFEFGLRLMERADAWESHYSPLDIVRTVLSGEGTTARSHGRALSLTSFLVNFDAVSPLRKRLIARLLELVIDQRPRVARLAASVLHDALREPHGMMGAAVPEEVRTKYRTEFKSTLASLKKLLKSGGVSATTAVAIARSVSWHAQYGTGHVQAAARGVLATIPKTLEFRLRASLANAQNDLTSSRRFGEHWEKEHAAWFDSLSTDLKSRYEAVQLRDATEDALKELSDAGEDLNSAYMVIGRLLKGDINLARAFVADARARPESLTRRYLSFALYELLDARPTEGRALVQEFLESGNPDLMWSASASFGGLLRNPDPEDLALIERALRSSEPRVVVSAIRSIWSWRRMTKRQWIDLARKANTDVSPAAIDELLMLFQDRRDESFSELSEDDIAHFLSRLERVEELNGHWTEEFLANVSLAYPHRFLDFVLVRLDHAIEQKSFSFRPLNFGPYSHVPLKLHESPALPAILSRIWAWLRVHPKRNDFHFRNHVDHVFHGLFAGGFTQVAAFFDTKLAGATRDDLLLIGRFLRDAPTHFVFDQQSFVVRLLERCREIGSDLVKDVTKELYHSAAYGVRSGVVGQPTVEDRSQREKANKALRQISRLSPAYALYDNLRRSAEDGITQSIRDGEALDDQ